MSRAVKFDDPTVKGNRVPDDREDPLAVLRAERWERDETVLLFDASVMCYRAFHTRDLSAPDGRGTSVLHGVIQMVRGVCDAARTRRWLLVWDGGLAYKRDVYPGYKVRHDRKRSPEEQRDHDRMRAQIRTAREELAAIGAPSFSHPDIEADDLIGYASGLILAGMRRGLNPTIKRVCVVSDDKDVYQLIAPPLDAAPEKGRTIGYRDEGLVVYRGAAGKVVDEAAFYSQFGFGPEWYADYKALVGEPATGDNIPGVNGVGDVTAAKLIAVHAVPNPKVTTTPLSSIIFAALDEIKKPKCQKIYQSIAKERNAAYLSHRLSWIARSESDLLTWPYLRGRIGSLRADAISAIRLACKVDRPCDLAAVKRLRTELGFTGSFDKVMWESSCGFVVK